MLRSYMFNFFSKISRGSLRPFFRGMALGYDTPKYESVNAEYFPDGSFKLIAERDGRRISYDSHYKCPEAIFDSFTALLENVNRNGRPYFGICVPAISIVETSPDRQIKIIECGRYEGIQILIDKKGEQQLEIVAYVPDDDIFCCLFHRREFYPNQQLNQSTLERLIDEHETLFWKEIILLDVRKHEKRASKQATIEPEEYVFFEG